MSARYGEFRYQKNLFSPASISVSLSHPDSSSDSTATKAPGEAGALWMGQDQVTNAAVESIHSGERRRNVRNWKSSWVGRILQHSAYAHGDDIRRPGTLVFFPSLRREPGKDASPASPESPLRPRCRYCLNDEPRRVLAITHGRGYSIVCGAPPRVALRAGLPAFPCDATLAFSARPTTLTRDVRANSRASPMANDAEARQRLRSSVVGTAPARAGLAGSGAAGRR